MAISQNLKASIEEEVKLEMTPMIDVTFLLLIFFIVTLKFRVEEGKLEAKLPEGMGQARGAAQVDREKVRIRIDLERCNIPALLALNDLRMSVEEYYRLHGGGSTYAPGATDFDLVLSVGNRPTLRVKQSTVLAPSGQPTSTLRLYSMAGQEVPDTAILVAALVAARAAYGDDEATPVIIDSDRSATYLALTLALQAAHQAGFAAIQFAGKIGSS